MAKIPFLKTATRIRTLSGLWQYRGSLLRMFSDMIGGRYRASFLTRIALIAGIIYILSPVDFIPDFIPFLGWTDDAAVLYFLVRRLIGEVGRYEGRPRRIEETVFKIR